MNPRNPILSILFLAFSFSIASAQGTRLLRQPAISDTHIVFVYANDLWAVERGGDDAWRLTSNEGAETLPHFSPDGQWIAFTAQYDGNTDVYVMPVQGGQPERLTWHPGADRVSGWTPDGTHVIFVSGREGVPTRESRFFKVPREGGFPEPLPVPRAEGGQMSADGRYMAYQEIGFWDPEWRNYRGGQAKPIWILDLEDHSLVATSQADGERHMKPIWHGDKVFFISERDYAANIWSFDPASGELEQETFHVDFDVKNLNSGGDVIVYEQGGGLHVLDPGNGTREPLVIHVRGDFHWSRDRWEDVGPTALQNPSLSPTGKRALFEYRGDIFTVPKEHGPWRNITRSPGAADRFPVWSPDGNRIAWFSDESGEYRLMVGGQDGMTPPVSHVLPEPSFFFRPAWSPDGRFIAYTDTHLNLWVFNLESGEASHVDTDRYVRPERTMNPVWSPDSKWIAYAHTLENMFKAIVVYNVDTGKRIQVTDGMADAISPVWDAGGKFLYFLASTDYGLNTGWLDMSSYDRPTTRGLYAAVLEKEGTSPFLPRSDEESPGGAGEIGKAQGVSRNGGESGNGNDQPGEAASVVIDEEGLLKRVVAVDVPLRNYTGLVAGPAHFVFFLESVPNQRGLTMHRYDFTKREAEPFVTPVQEAVSSQDRKSVLYRSGSSWGIVDAGGPAKKPGDGRLEAVGGLRMRIEPMAEWKQIFKEGWRFQRDFLYVDNVHGAPWNEVYEWYRPWVDHVRHRSDLNYVVEIMGGEVAIGHSYVSGGDMPGVEQIPVGLLGADFVVEEGHFRLARIYDGENWNPGLDAPLSRPGLAVNEGDFLLEVNGVQVDASQNLYKYFEATAGRQTSIRVNESPTLQGSRLLTVIPVANESQLRMMDWVEGNRRKVDALSDGRLAYVYLPNTGGGGYTFFNRYYFAQQDKKGAVIDQRNNGGGSAADYMIDIMGRELHGYFNSKAADRKPFTTPMAGIWGPKVMVINERAGSGGDLLPYMFRQAGLGPLIGTRTWGGLVGIWDTPVFVDGGRMMAPRGGFFDIHGNWAVEAEGVAPDIEVEQWPEAVIRGRDPQLERAVEEALRLLETEGVELQAEPDPPVRYRRPDPRQ
ncbi:MAG: PDZ domain-containing protein [Bacteroidales bacterium]